MSETELRTVFNVFIDNKIVTDLELQKAGFNVQNIKKLQEKNVVAKLGTVFILKKTYYSELLLYGISLLRKNIVKKAKEVFELCLKLKPDNVKVLYYIFLSDLKLKDYKKAIEYYKAKPQSKWTNDEKFILFIIGLIIPVPKEYAGVIVNFRDNYLKKGKDLDSGKFAKVIESALNFEFKDAKMLLKAMDYDDIKKDIYEELLTDVIEKLINLNNIFNLLKNNNQEIAKPLIREYLITKRKLSFYKLISLLLYLSSRTTGINEIIMNLLTSIETDENVKLDISSLIELYNDDMENRNYSEAKHIYLILEEINNLGILNINLVNFSKCLLLEGNN